MQENKLGLIIQLKENYSNKCGFTLSRGKNKGELCGKTCILGYGYCKTHLDKVKKKHGNFISDLALPISNAIKSENTQSNNSS